MIPRILQIGPIPINSFGLMVALGFFAGMYVLARSFERNGLPPELAEKYVIAAAISGLLGARLWFIMIYYGEINRPFIEVLFSSAGFVFYGGFLIALATLFILTRIDKISFAKFIDSVGPTMAIGYAIGRVGCQLSGDGDYGLATTSFWGMSYAQGVVPTPPGIEAFPTPVFESVMALLVCAVLLKVEKDRLLQAPFSRFGLYLLFMSIERFLIEFIRIEDRYAYGLSEAQLIAVGLFLVGLILTLRNRFVSA